MADSLSCPIRCLQGRRFSFVTVLSLALSLSLSLALPLSLPLSPLLLPSSSSRDRGKTSSPSGVDPPPSRECPISPIRHVLCRLHAAHRVWRCQAGGVGRTSPSTLCSQLESRGGSFLWESLTRKATARLERHLGAFEGATSCLRQVQHKNTLGELRPPAKAKDDSRLSLFLSSRRREHVGFRDGTGRRPPPCMINL